MLLSFKPRSSLVDIFSQFLVPITDFSVKWSDDYQLKQNIENVIKNLTKENVANFQSDMSEDGHKSFFDKYFIETYFHQIIGNKIDLSQEGNENRKKTINDLLDLKETKHLLAESQEQIYRESRRIANNIEQQRNSGNDIQYSFADCLQTGNELFYKIIVNFDSNKYRLEVFLHYRLYSEMSQELLEKIGLDNSSLYATLRELNKTRIKRNLKIQGFSPQSIDRRILVWECFCKHYKPEKKGNRSLPEPDDKTWQNIVQSFNKANNLSINLEEIKKFLSEIVKAERNRHRIKTESIDLDFLNDNSKSENHKTNPELQVLSLLDELIEKEYEEIIKNQKLKIRAFLEKIVAQLKAEKKELLELYYSQGLTQKEIGVILNKHQTNVARNLKTIRKSLLTDLGNWVARELKNTLKEMEITFNSQKLFDLDQKILEEFLIDYFSI